MKFSTLLSLIAVTSLFLLPQHLFAQNAENELEYRKWRITLFPPLSTNGVDAPNYSAKYSINLLGGYHGALDGAEFGSLINYTKHYSHGFQLAGGANITGGNMAGLNFAGITNISKNDMSGIQLAGILNSSGDDLSGIQAAGLFNNAHGSISGIQFAGIGNISRESIEGLQSSGIINATQGDLSGLQLAGFMNFAGGEISGLQSSGMANISMGDISGLMASGGANIAQNAANGLLVSGAFNYAKQLNGLAISGGANISEELQGMQLAGILNLSRKATGLQIGVINLAQNFEGVPIGLISLYGNGRKNLDIRFSDGGFTDIGINLGTYRVYNMAVLGYNTLLNRDVYRVGFAVGLEKNIQEAFPNIQSKTLYINQEFSMLHHFEDEWSRRLNRIYSYKYHLGKRFGSGFSLYAGPTFNMQVTRVQEASDYSWYSLWSPSAKGKQYKFWVGFSIGIRLFKQKDMPLFNNEFDGWELDW